jgi:hypothetical protein
MSSGGTSTSPETTASQLQDQESEDQEPQDQETAAQEPKPKPKPPPLATKFSDKRNTIAGIDRTNKTWKGGYDLKPGKYRTVDDFDPKYTPSPGFACTAWSSPPDSDDLEGERAFDRTRS